MDILKLRLSMTPAGMGCFILVVPGLLVGLAAKEPAFVAIGIGAACLLAVNAIWARAVLREIEVVLSSGEAATVGASHKVDVVLREPSGVNVEVLVHPDAVDRWISSTVPARGVVSLRPEVRGHFTAFEGRVRTTYPFGLVQVCLWFAAKVEPSFDVAPAAIDTSVPWPIPRASRFWPRRGEELVGIRPYVAGDPRKDIHWHSVARTGVLMVKDRQDRDDREVVCVRPDLGELTPDQVLEVDAVLGRTRSVVAELLRNGVSVKLRCSELIVEPEATSVEFSNAQVTSIEDLHRRLARCVADPTEPARESDCLELVVSGQEASWRG